MIRMIKTYGYTDNTQLSPHFNAQEFRCKCGKEHDFQIDDDLIAKLETLFSTLNCSCTYSLKIVTLITSFSFPSYGRRIYA